ncbi:MAG: MFS transporter, partial [Actinomycetota bacterium]|nr:MFS transporter [Actinomycetota bacterium]
DGVDQAALPLLAATLTRDPVLFSGVAVALRLPWLLFALQAGAIADRVDRKRLMAGANLVRFGLMGVIGLAVLGGWASIWLLYAVGFALGIAETLFDNAAQAIMPALVHRERLETANGRLQAAEITANQFAGPPLGGALFAALAAAPFLLDAGTFLVSALLIATIAGSFRPARAGPTPQARRRLRHDIAEGLRWLWNHRLLRTLALMLGLVNGTAVVWGAIFPLFALEVLGLSEVGYGVLLTATAAGSVLASLVAGRIVPMIGRGPALIASVMIFGGATIAMGLSSNPLVVGALEAALGFAVVTWNIITVSLRQSIIPQEILGRVNSVYRFVGWGSIPVGALLGGVLADAFGLRAPFIIAGAAQLVALVAILPVVNSRNIEAARTAPPAAD